MFFVGVNTLGEVGITETYDVLKLDSIMNRKDRDVGITETYDVLKLNPLK
ncbi:MAG: hypothetical protein ACFWT2_11825 [Thermoanaerobacterium thermosaccharolyticum]